jgi:GAF domain-containing protein
LELLLDDPPTVAHVLDASGETSTARYDAARVAEVTATATGTVGVTGSSGPRESVMVVPLLAEHYMVGMLYLACGADQRIFTPLDLDTLEGVAGQAALVLYNLGYREALRLKVGQLEAKLEANEPGQSRR